jgi:hypothetical protein
MLWFALAVCVTVIIMAIREEAFVRHLMSVRDENIEAQRQNGGRLE